MERSKFSSIRKSLKARNLFRLRKLPVSADYDRKKIKRPGFIKVKYRGLDDKEYVQTAAKGYAALLSHEIDHLNGTLYIDYARFNT